MIGKPLVPYRHAYVTRADDDTATTPVQATLEKLGFIVRRFRHDLGVPPGTRVNSLLVLDYRLVGDEKLRIIEAAKIILTHINSKGKEAINNVFPKLRERNEDDSEIFAELNKAGLAKAMELYVTCNTIIADHEKEFYKKDHAARKKKAMEKASFKRTLAQNEMSNRGTPADH